jgi:hypothetical protein
MQYFITYGLGWQAPANKKANLGTVTHKVLELLANFKLMIQNKNKKSYEYIDSETGNFVFTKKTLMSDKLIEELLKRCYLYYTTNTPDIDYDDKKDFDFCKEMVYNCLEYNNGQFDPRVLDILEPEKSFDIEITEPWAYIDYNGERKQLRIKGTMDLIVNAGKNTLEYVDYKTGQRKNWSTGEEKTYAKLHDDIQLLLYYYALKKLYPEYHVIMTIFFLRDGGPFSLCFDDTDEKKFLEMLKVKFFEIKNCKNPKPLNKWRSDFKCKKLCHYYKTEWPETGTTMCHHAENTIKLYGIEGAVSKLSKPGFKADFYAAPGAIQKGDDNANSK